MSIQLYTPVAVDRQGLSLTPGDKVMLLGSCFADHIGDRLRAGGFEVLQNPFGVLYNPLSICQCLRRCIDLEYVDEGDLVQYDGVWHSWLHHSRFSNADRQRCLDACNASIQSGHEFLKSCTLLTLTFGTAYVYELQDEGGWHGRVVSNCHKVPASRFIKRRASLNEMLAVCNDTLQRLRRINTNVFDKSSGESKRRSVCTIPRRENDCLKETNIKVQLTVSPIRHSADGARGNQLSKSLLHLLCDELQHSCDACYFPAYEIVMDELRDYRFYDADMLHLSATAVEILWQRYAEAYFPQETMRKVQENQREARAAKHRRIIT